MTNYDQLIEKWGEEAVTEAQEILADENETYQEIEGRFIELDEQGKGSSPEAVILEAKLLAMVDRFLILKRGLFG